MPLSDLFLEKGIFNRDDHIELQEKSQRRDQANSITHHMLRANLADPIGDCLCQQGLQEVIGKLACNQKQAEAPEDTHFRRFPRGKFNIDCNFSR